MNERQIRQSMRESGEYRMRGLDEFTVTKTEPQPEPIRKWRDVYMLMTEETNLDTRPTA